MRRYKSSYKPRSIKRTEKKAKRNLIITALMGTLLLYLIFTWGLPALIGGLSTFNKFKPKTQNTIVEDSAVTPPVLNIPYEATNSANIKISGFASAKSKVEIYIDDELKSTTNTEGDGTFTTDNIPLSLGNNNIYGKTIDEANKQSLPSKTIKLIYNNEKPKLEINEPSDNQEIKGGDKKVKVSGKTDPQSNISINGNNAIVNSEGNFSKEIDINEGDNTITINAVNQVGNNTTIERKVKYSP